MALESLPPLTRAPIGPSTCAAPRLRRKLAHAVDVEALVVASGMGSHRRSQNGLRLRRPGVEGGSGPAASLEIPSKSVRGPGTVRNVR